MPPKDFDFFTWGMNPAYNWQQNWPAAVQQQPDPYTPKLSFKDKVNNYLNKYSTDKYSLVNAAINGGTNLAGSLINNSGLSSTAGNIMSGIGNIVGNIPGPIGWAGKGLALAGQAVNALWGHKFNDANVAAAENANRERNNWQFGDYSNTDALLAGSMANVQLGNVSKGFLGKEGPFSNAVTNKMNQINNDRIQANLRANNSELNAYNNYQTGMVRNAIAGDSMGNVNAAAYGGPLNIFDIGGKINMNRMFTHGSLFSNGLTQINNGGSHEQNPHEGVQYGVDEYGIPNLVEEGETVFNAGAYGGPDSYSFSDRLKFPKEYANLFSLGGRTKRMKGKRGKSYTFADVSKLLSKESEERPNDDKSLRTLAENLGRLAGIQEEVKAKQMLDQMNPLDVMMALQQSPMADQMGAMQGMDQQAMMQEGEQQPMMAACGGKLHGLGGNLFAGGGDTEDPLSALRLNYLQQLGGFDLQDYINNIQDFDAYRGKGTGRKSSARSKGSSNYTYSNDKKIKIDDTPESTILHEGLFQKAISEWLEKQKNEYDKAVSEKRYQDAYKIADNIRKQVYGINAQYYGTYNYDRTKYKTPNKRSIERLQKSFNDLQLNKYVNEYLNTKTNDKYPVYINGEGYLNDDPLDSSNGVVTQNRYITFTDDDIKKLNSMGLNIDSYQNSIDQYIRNYYKNVGTPEQYYEINPSLKIRPFTSDLQKNLQLLIHDPQLVAEDGSIKTYNRILNPAYEEGSTDPLKSKKYISLDEDVLQYAPKDTKDAAEWWKNLSDEEKQNILQLHYTVNDALERTGVYENSRIYTPLNSSSTSSSTADSSTEEQKQGDSQEYYVPKPRPIWENAAATAIAGIDYFKSLFGNNQNPGINAAYASTADMANIPVVRNHPVANLLSFRPSNIESRLGQNTNQEFGLIRNASNLGMGMSNAETLNLINKANELRGQIRQQTAEEDDKRLQTVVGLNNQALLADAQGSLNAQQANAQAMQKAKEARAQIYAGLANTFASNYKTWLDYQNAQSSGLAQILHDQGYNKQVLNLRDAAFLLNNQQKDALKAAGISYEVVQDILNGNYKG